MKRGEGYSISFEINNSYGMSYKLKQIILVAFQLDGINSWNYNFNSICYFKYKNYN